MKIEIEPNQPAHYQMTDAGGRRWLSRAEIAMHIMAGFAADPKYPEGGKHAASAAVVWADCLIAELNK